MLNIKYYEIPYKPRGRDFDGCDCWGFALLFLKEEAGIKVMDYAYADDPLKIDVGVYENLALEFAQIDETALKRFDLLLLHDNSQSPNHVGVALDGRLFIHCIRGRGVAVSKISTWKKHIMGVYRYTGDKK